MLGIMNLAKTFGDERLEAACQRALNIKAKSYTSVKSILKNGLDQKQAKQGSQQMLPITHQNIRGKNYYAPKKGEVNLADQPDHG